MTQKVDEYRRKTYSTYYQDGFVEVAVGLLLVVVGGLLLIWQNMSLSTSAKAITILGLAALLVGGIFGARWIVQWAKERVTFSRTGYVAYREGEPAGNRWIFLGPTLVLFIAMIFLPETFLKIQFAIGYFSAVAFCYLGYRLGLWRFYIIGEGAFLLGSISTIFIADEAVGTGLVIIGIGLLLLLAGVFTLISFIRHNPEPGDGQI